MPNSLFLAPIGPVWTWLLRHLPASVVGFTVFLNPPLANGSKIALAVLWAATFTLQMSRWNGSEPGSP